MSHTRTLNSAEEKMLERGVRVEDKPYFPQELSKIELLYQTPVSNTNISGQQPATFVIPTSPAFLAAFPDAGGDGACLAFDVYVSPQDGSSPTNGFVGCNPWMFFSSYLHTVNGVQTNVGDTFLSSVTSATLADIPVGALWSDYQCAGVQVYPGNPDQPFGSCIDLGGQSMRLDTFNSTSLTLGNGSTGNVAIPGVTSQSYQLPANVLQMNVPRRVRLPLSILCSGLLNDHDSLVPLAPQHVIQFYGESQLQRPVWEITTTPASETTPATAPRALKWELRNLELWYPVASPLGYLAALTDKALSENRWKFRTTTRKVYSISFNFDPADINGAVSAGRGSINFGNTPVSGRSIETFIEANGALTSPNVGSKMYYCQNGIFSWQYLNNGRPLPVSRIVRTGWVAPGVGNWGFNNTDGLMYHNGYRRSKWVQERQYPYLASSCYNNYNFDGTSDIKPVLVDSTYQMTPQCGTYPYCGRTQDLSISGDATVPATAAEWRANSKRLFRMALDLTSADNSDDYLSGEHMGQIILNLQYSQLRDRYASSTGQALTCSSCNFIMVQRCNALVTMGSSYCNVADTSIMVA